MLERVAKKGEPGPAPLPKLSTWTPEVDRLTDLLDAVRHLETTLVRVNVGKEASKVKDYPPVARPGRPGQQDPNQRKIAQMTEKQEAQHRRVVAALLPTKGDNGGPASQ